jgi:peptide/nickel transport system permease protein
MSRIILKKLLYFIPTLLAASLILFVLLSLIPGETAFLSGSKRKSMDVETMERIRIKWGLNDPIPIRYAKYMRNLLTGDMGISFRTNRKVFQLIKERLPATLFLVGGAMLFAVTGGLLLGAVSGIKEGSAIDIASMLGAVAGISIPNFWLGMMLMYFFSVKLGWLPSSGYGGGSLQYLIMPSITLGAAYMALIARVTRASILDAKNFLYVQTARSKGLSENVVRMKHIFRNAMIPVVTVIGLQLGSLLAYTVVVEKVFAWPGIGLLLVNSIFRRDVPVVQGCVLFIVFSFLVINLLVDILYMYIDPRIKYEANRL